MKRRLAVVAVVSVIGLSAAGWYLLKGQPAVTPPHSSTKPQQTVQLDPNGHDFFDVDFAQKMITHHQQAMKMADMVIAKSGDQDVRQFAEQVRSKQSDAAEQYISWLNEWDEPYTNLADFPQMDGHDMYPSYPGLVSMADLTTLESATGTQADALFISLMIKHHTGGIDLEQMSNKLQYGKLVEYKDKVFGEYAIDIERMKSL